MTQEEKAKAYDKAVKEASITYKDRDKHLKAALERIFPELKESEDERIRKELTEYDDRYVLTFENQDKWELVFNKFDITTLKPFESRVLVRDYDDDKWYPGIWGFYDKDAGKYHYKIIGDIVSYCIPYEGNEHLLGTTDDCNEFYKTWE